MEEGMRGFVTVESGFYPEARTYFDTVLEGYLDGVEAANREEEVDEEA